MNRLSTMMLTSTMALVMVACAGAQLPPYGIREGELPPCADHRTCLSSHPEEHEAAAVDPLEYDGNRRDARSTLAAIIMGFPGARVVSSHRSYLRVEFTGSVARDGDEFYFEPESVVDEVEFYFPPQRQIIHVRAAARSGPIDGDRGRDRFQALQVLIEEYQDKGGRSSLRL